MALAGVARGLVPALKHNSIGLQKLTWDGAGLCCLSLQEKAVPVADLGGIWLSAPHFGLGGCESCRVMVVAAVGRSRASGQQDKKVRRPSRGGGSRFDPGQS